MHIHILHVCMCIHSWVKRFGEHNGLDIILDTMRSCSQSNFAGKDAVLRRIQHQCVRCLKAFMNNKVSVCVCVCVCVCCW